MAEEKTRSTDEGNYPGGGLTVDAEESQILDVRGGLLCNAGTL